MFTVWKLRCIRRQWRKRRWGQWIIDNEASQPGLQLYNEHAVFQHLYLYFVDDLHGTFNEHVRSVDHEPSNEYKYQHKYDH